jgi:hypothetical protein
MGTISRDGAWGRAWRFWIAFHFAPSAFEVKAGFAQRERRKKENEQEDATHQ